MYNKEQKEKFIAFQTESESLQKALRIMFDRTEKFEQSCGHDLCEMSDDELQETVDDVFGVSTVSKRARLSNIREYVRWCRVNGAENVTNAVDHINIAGMDKFKRQMTASPMHLQKCLDIAYSPESMETVDNIYRGYLWLGFMGFPESEIINLTRYNLDFNDMTMRYGGKSFPIYAESVPALRNCAELKAFNYYHDTPSYVSQLDRFASNGLIRGIKGDFNPLTMRSKINKKVREFADTGTPIFQLSYKRLVTSGLFYRLYSAERAGIANSARHFFTDYFTERDILPTSVDMMTREYIKDYDRWKLAFGI